jgi:hypothetical protein
MMVCDVTSAATEFMVRVLHSRGVLLSFTPLLGLKRCRACEQQLAPTFGSYRSIP